MNRSLYLRFATVLGVGVLSWLMLWPSIAGLSPKLRAPAWVTQYFTHRISPGLDIRGGMRLMYQVEVEEYVRDLRDRKADELLRQLGLRLGVLEDEEVAAPPAEKIETLRERVRVERVGERSIRVRFTRPADTQRLTRDWLRERFPDFKRESADANTVLLTFRDERIEEMRDTAVAQAAHTIGERIDTLGLREASVSHREEDLIIEVPGADEETFERMRSIIARTARLEFKVLDDGADWLPADTQLPEGVSRQSEGTSAGTSRPNVTNTFLMATGTAGRQALEQVIAGLSIPDDHMVLLGRVEGSRQSNQQDDEIWRTYYAYDATEVTGEDVDSAMTAYDQQRANEPYVAIRFKADGADEFAELTGRNVKRRMAIVLDDIVQSAPVIQDRIAGGNCSITLGGGGYRETQQQADDLVVVLKSGSLPAPLRPSNEQLIGPTLGRDAVQQGAYGAVTGIGLVAVFMVVYYQYAGLVAAVMILLNLLLQLALMAFFEATLTLPGIAATALTVGMAVDANVLITERIRDELRAGKSARSAVDQGFDRAFWSIMDSQLTTFIAAVVLFQFGTGPIKGFAVMLMIGIFTSLFTGLFGSRVFMDLAVRALKWDRIPVG